MLEKDAQKRPLLTPDYSGGPSSTVYGAKLSEGARYRYTHALRQTLAAAVRWRYLQRNPAIDAGRNPKPRRTELHPFAPEEIDRLAAELGFIYGPLVIFAAES